MQFIFNLMNHNRIGQSSLEDLVAIVGHQLRALGHTVIYNPGNTELVHESAGINVIVEGFTPGSIKILRDYYEKGARYLFIATEEPTPDGFNHGTQKEMVFRQEYFPEAAKMAEAIFYLGPHRHALDWYGQFAPTAYCELGYAPGLMRLSKHEPRFEFGFFGSLTPRRERILRKLSKRLANRDKAIRVVADFPSQGVRDMMMQDCKVILVLRKFEQMGVLSNSRCNTSLCIGRPVICEPHEYRGLWGDVVAFSQSELTFYDEALAMRKHWREVYEGQVKRFKELMPPEKCVGAALEQVGLCPAHVN